MSTLMRDLSCSNYNVNAAIAALALPVSPACGPISNPLQPDIRISQCMPKVRAQCSMSCADAGNLGCRPCCLPGGHSILGPLWYASAWLLQQLPSRNST